MTKPVVVGVDDIDHSWHAVTVAVREARLRRAPLWLAHAYEWLPPVTVGLMSGSGIPQAPVRDSVTELSAAVADAATRLLDAAVAKVKSAFPDVDVHSRALNGPAAEQLAGLADDAALLVVGGRGRGGFAGLLLGSVALRTVALAPCPVLVVRGSGHPATDRITVGVDVGHPAGTAQAVARAFEEAALRGAELRAAYVWADPAYLYAVSVSQYTQKQLDAIAADQGARLEAALDPWRGKDPDVPLSTHVARGNPGRVLIDASRESDVVVLGARRRRDGGGVRLGGLAHTVLHHAECPVLIVPED